MTIPNAITLIRIAAIPLFAAFLLLPGYQNKIIAAAIYSVLVLSDAVDGYLARRLNKVSDFGKYLDPLADKILVITALLGLIELKAVSSIPVMIIVAREFAVTAFRLEAGRKGLVIPADILGKWKTAFQMLAVFFLILSWPYGELVLWFSVILTVVSGIDYIYKSWAKVF